MKEFQDDILGHVVSNDVPIMFLKFEELRKEPREHIYDVFRFMLCQRDLSGTYIEHKIDQALALGHEATQAYKMKSHDGKFNAIDRFPPALQEHIKTELAPYCQFFDYFITDPDADNQYRFFEPPEGWKADPSLGNYKDETKRAIDEVDGTPVEYRASREVRYDSHIAPRVRLWTGKVRVKDP